MYSVSGVFVPKMYWNFYAGNLDFHIEGMGDYLRSFSPGALRQQLRGAGASSLATAGSIAVTEVSVTITPCMGRRDSSQVPWHMVRDPIAPTKAFLSKDGCQIFVVEEGY